jgi:hypothetical protein
MAAHLVKGLPSFMVGLLPSSQQTPSGPYLEPDELNPHPQTQFLKSSLILFPYAYNYQMLYFCFIST